MYGCFSFLALSRTHPVRRLVRGPFGPGTCGPPWALWAEPLWAPWALVGRSLVGPLGPCGLEKLPCIYIYSVTIYIYIYICISYKCTYIYQESGAQGRAALAASQKL